MSINVVVYDSNYLVSGVTILPRVIFWIQWYVDVDIETIVWLLGYYIVNENFPISNANVDRM